MSQQPRKIDLGDRVRTTIVLSPDYNLAEGRIIEIIPNAGNRHETLYIVEFDFGTISLTAEQIESVTKVD